MNATRCAIAVSVLLVFAFPPIALGQDPTLGGYPSRGDVVRLLTLQDYNTRVVLIGVTLLGAASGLVGSFTLLRKRALMGDAISHATLPGIGVAFIAATLAGYNGKSLPLLLLGATLSGLLGVAVVLGVRRGTRLKEDTLLGAVLSVFFGAGAAMLSLAKDIEGARPAGLEAFIYGKTALMSEVDAQLIAAAAVVAILGCVLLLKELKLLCFDEAFAGSRGYPVGVLDLSLMAMVVMVCIVGLQAVGLVLMIALLVIPAAAARFWTERMERMAAIAAAIGGAGGLMGAALSALFWKLPSGPMIVLSCTSLFAVSLLLGARRGVVQRLGRRRRLNRSVAGQHLLRALFELAEEPAETGVLANTGSDAVGFDAVLRRRSWTPQQLRRAVRRAEANGDLRASAGTLSLTPAGLSEARRLTRQHRLWELYLIRYADTAPARVDRDADAIEHVLEPELVHDLEAALDAQSTAMPETPHQLPADAFSTDHGGSDGRA